MTDNDDDQVRHQQQQRNDDDNYDGVIRHCPPPAETTVDVANTTGKDDDEKKNQTTKEKSHDHGGPRWYSCCRCLARLPYTWPRVSKFVFGIVVPLFALIALSAVCGYGLAALEGPQEQRANDQVSANNAMTDYVEELANNLTAHIPRICHLLYLRNVTVAQIMESPLWQQLRSNNTREEEGRALPTLAQFLDTSFPFEDFGASVNNDTDIGDTHGELQEYMVQCGSDFAPLVGVVDEVLDNYESTAGDFTLNWNRCVKRGEHTNPFSLLFNVTAIRPEVQLANRQEEFDRNLEELYEQYLAEILAANETTAATSPPLVARTVAFMYAAGNATGSAACQTNVNAAAWFWFTIETTIGYGNQSVQTVGGRAMVYTLGFLCILTFAGILAAAGSVALTIVDVFMVEHDLRVSEATLEKYGPINECIFWGVTYYLWMLVVAAYARSWKHSRLGETEFSLAEGYWFAYISTTTVGFGDIFLEPSVIVGKDNVVWPLLFLIGFVFLSAFLGKFAELLQRFLPAATRNDTFRERCEKAPIIRSRKNRKRSKTPNTDEQDCEDEEKEQERDEPPLAADP